MPRLFIAIELPDFVKEQLVLLQRFPIPGARRTQPEQMHLTLHFIGEVDAAKMVQIIDALLAFRHDAFELSLEEVGHFPPKGKPRVLWVGVSKSEGLASLHQLTAAALAQVGLPPEEKAYHPHITLSRLRITPPPNTVKEFLDKYQSFRTVPFPVEEFILYSSVLSVQGPTYTPEVRFALR